MLNVKFPDYSYGKVAFDSFSIDDGEVVVSLSKLDKENFPLENKDYEYAGNDFYKFVPTEEVEVLVNEKDETLLTMVSTGVDKVVEGTKAELDDEYDALQDKTYDYAYTLIEKKDIAESTKLTVDSEYIYEVKDNDKNVRLNKTTYDDKKYDDAIVIINGERASLRDVEEGTVLSKVTVDGSEFFIVSSETVEGKFTKYVEKDYENSKKYRELTIGGNTYTEATTDNKASAKYVEDPEDSKEKETKLLSSANETVRKDMKNEEVVAYLDFLGRVARLDFDGNIGDDSSSEIAFYAVTANIENPSSRTYTIGLANIDGDEEYNFEKGSRVARSLFNEDLEGAFVAVTFNDDGEITDIVKVARAEKAGPDVIEEAKRKFTYDEEAEDGKGYYELVDLGNQADFDDNEDVVKGNGKSYLVDEDTVLVTVILDDNGTTKTSDDEYKAEFAQGIEAVSNIKDERALVIYDAADKIVYAKYVVRFDDATNRDDVLTGILETAIEDKLGEYALTVNGEDYIYKVSDNATPGANITSYENGVIVFTLKENKNDDEKYVQFVSGIKVSEAVADDNMDDYVDDVSGKVVSFETSGDLNVTSKSFKDVYDNYVFVKVGVNDDSSIEEDKVVTSVAEEVIKCEDITAGDFAVGDRIIIDSEGEVFYIISGMEERGEAGEETTLTLDNTELSLEVGATGVLKATVNPADTEEVTWESNKPAVATVDNTGKVTAVAEGTATITAKAGEKSATCEVTVAAKIVDVTGVTLDKTELTLKMDGELTAKLTATVTPDDATNKTVTWTSSDETKVTVEDGTVTAVAGTEADTPVTITATAGDKTATCTVTVVPATTGLLITCDGLANGELSIEIPSGDTTKKVDLVTIVEPVGAEAVSYISDNTTIATVDNTGKITAKNPGTVKITAKSGTKTQTITVTVTKGA